jgi:dermatan/chondrotin sulfate uronyl 2-O-sulfotransferase UST
MKYDNNAVTKATVTSVPVVTSSVRRVTKSLEELRQNVKIPELSDHVIFFNRVPKSGSEMLVLLLQWLQGRNGFRHVRLGGGNVRRLSRMQQVRIVSEYGLLGCDTV